MPQSAKVAPPGKRQQPWFSQIKIKPSGILKQSYTILAHFNAAVLLWTCVLTLLSYSTADRWKYCRFDETSMEFGSQVDSASVVIFRYRAISDSLFNTKCAIWRDNNSFTLLKTLFLGLLVSWLLSKHYEQVLIVIWHKAALPPQADSSIVFARWHQCALPRGNIGTTCRIRLNFCFLPPIRIHNPDGRSDRSVQLFLHSSRKNIVWHAHARACPFP